MVGMWDLKFYHPSVTQELRLNAVTEEGTLNDSITDEAGLSSYLLLRVPCAQTG